VNPIKNGRNGSSQVNIEATPLIPASIIRAGIMQHTEAARAVNNPSPMTLSFTFMFLQGFDF